MSETKKIKGIPAVDSEGNFGHVYYVGLGELTPEQALLLERKKVIDYLRSMSGAVKSDSATSAAVSGLLGLPAQTVSWFFEATADCIQDSHHWNSDLGDE